MPGKRLRVALAVPFAGLAFSCATPGGAQAVDRLPGMPGSSTGAVFGLQVPAGGLQCVPYARRVSGIAIYGDAWTWWGQAAGRYDRGSRPRVGAVIAFKPYRQMRLGHVAAVSRIVDARTILLRHANWSPINGARGQIEDDVPAIDVSPDNDWSAVRVWFAPLQDLGATYWPVHGFIYNRRPEPQRKPPVPPLADDPIGAIIARYAPAPARVARWDGPDASAPLRSPAAHREAAPYENGKASGMRGGGR